MLEQISTTNNTALGKKTGVMKAIFSLFGHGHETPSKPCTRAREGLFGSDAGWPLRSADDKQSEIVRFGPRRRYV